MSERFQEMPPETIGDRPFRELYRVAQEILSAGGISSDEILHLHSVNLAQRLQMIRAFSEPEGVLAKLEDRVAAVVERFPREASDLEVGRNPGDVLDPFILSATQTLMYDGSFDSAINTMVAHKALMMIEGLLGHLHEDVVGEFRGNMRSPEPRGFHQEHLDTFTNPFPGSDIVQPPMNPGETLRFFQVKSKTGSAKGGDGKRLGEQLLRLQQYYDGRTYYCALIGNTLRGHRSMNGVLRASPETVVLVGAAAFRALTRSEIGPELLLRVYQNAFSAVARKAGYSLPKMAKIIAATFKHRAEDRGDEYLDTLLRDAVDGPEEQQDSRLYSSKRRR